MPPGQFHHQPLQGNFDFCLVSVWILWVHSSWAMPSHKRRGPGKRGLPPDFEMPYSPWMKPVFRGQSRRDYDDDDDDESQSGSSSSSSVSQILGLATGDEGDGGSEVSSEIPMSPICWSKCFWPNLFRAPVLAPALSFEWLNFPRKAKSKAASSKAKKSKKEKKHKFAKEKKDKKSKKEKKQKQNKETEDNSSDSEHSEIPRYFGSIWFEVLFGKVKKMSPLPLCIIPF